MSDVGLAMQMRIALLATKGALSELPEAERTKVRLAASKIREVLQQYGEQGEMALAMVSLEIAVEEGKKP